MHFFVGWILMKCTCLSCFFSSSRMIIRQSVPHWVTQELLDIWSSCIPGKKPLLYHFLLLLLESDVQEHSSNIRMNMYTLHHIYIYIHDMTWHDMTWHDMIWHDMTWHDTRYITYVRTYAHTYIPTYTYIPAYTYIRTVGMCLHTYIPASVHSSIPPSIHPSIHTIYMGHVSWRCSMPRLDPLNLRGILLGSRCLVPRVPSARTTNGLKFALCAMWAGPWKLWNPDWITGPGHFFGWRV